MTGYVFTDLAGPTTAAARKWMLEQQRQGKMPPMFTLENIPEQARQSILLECGGILQGAAPVIALDVFLEIRSALQQVVWGPEAEPLTDEQKTLWDGLTGVLGDVQQRLTEGT